MSPALANFLFEAANFVVLAAILGKVLFQPVRRALDAERERHGAEGKEAERLRAEAESTLREAQAAREAAARESEERRREVLAAAEQEAARAREEARRAQAAERRAHELDLAAARDVEAAALAEEVGRIAAESVRRLLAALDAPSLDAALVRAACAELQALPRADGGSAVVESARPLEPGAREMLAHVLGDGFAERVVGELGAGVRVTTPAGQVDSTATSLARRAARAVGAAAEGAAAGSTSATGSSGG